MLVVGCRAMLVEMIRILDKWVFKQFACCWSLSRVSFEAASQKILPFRGQIIWNWWVRAQHLKHCSRLQHHKIYIVHALRILRHQFIF